IGPMSSVAMWFVPSASGAASSHVTISRPSCAASHFMIAGRFCFIQVSPTVVLQSCMSLHMLGTTMASDAADHGNGWLSAPGTLEKSAHGLCLRRYNPLLPSHPVKPALGIDSA